MISAASSCVGAMVVGPPPSRAPRARADHPVALLSLILRRVRQRAFVIQDPYVIPRVEIAAANVASEKVSASLTRRVSARSPTTVPRGLGSSSDMIAGIWPPP